MAGNDGVEWDEVQPDQYGPDEAAAVALGKSESLGGGFIPADPDDEDFADPGARKPVRTLETTDNFVRKVGPGAGYLQMPKRKKYPKIYFGTRTHKQVTQIVRELKKTAYAGARMTILASREHTCIHPTISKSFNKNQDCQDLMDKKKGGGCRFQANVKVKMASHHSVRAYIGTDQAWDLEDLVKAGKKVKACPYYAVRELKNSAQIIFCPYNYLVDPGIRGAMDISLKNQIVILDEAHNIEDSAREAASGHFKLDDVTVAMQDCERMVQNKILPGTHSGLAAFLSRLGTWMQKSAEDAKDYTDFNSSTKVWSGTAGLAEWNEIVFYPESYQDIKSKLQEAVKEQSAASEQNDDGFEEGQTKIMSKKTSDLMEGIFTALDFMHRKDSRYRDDFKMSVVKGQERKKGGKAKGWTGRGDAPALVTTITLNFWCLNPGVCFDEMLDCKSIILTSGTLSPMVTFASELEVKFPITLEANHVIDKSQVWVGTVGHGPTGGNLNASYKNASTYGFQDEVGRLVLEICKTVPHGVLVFFPSYKMLNDLSERWKSNGTWQQLFERKAIVTEPRFGDQLEVAMKEFYSVIEASHHHPNEFGQDGALFMAVCRGKVSEGLDFADNNARAVVCVGIPFPAFKDTLVDLKKKYNDGRRVSNPNILPGREWYEIQAFRALNQALGRCIRHKKDWGAILMVDDRYGSNPRYVNSLSKWVRGKVINYNNNCGHMLQTLKTFAADMKHLDAENSSDVVDAFTAQPKDPPESDSPADSKQGQTNTADSKQGQTNTAWSPNPGTSQSLASKVSSLVSLRKSSPTPKSTKDLKGWGSKRRKSVEATSSAEINRNQPQIPNLSTGNNLDTKGHLTSVLDSNSQLLGLMGLGSKEPIKSPSDASSIPLDGDKVRLGPPKSRGRQKKLQDQIKFKQSKVDWNAPEGTSVESSLPNMNFNDPVASPDFEESFETLYNNSTSNSSLISSSNRNLKIVQGNSQKPRKMQIVSSDEEDTPKKPSCPNISTFTNKSTVSNTSSSKPLPEPATTSKPLVIPYATSKTVVTKHAPCAPSSPIFRSDSCKRKTCSSSESVFDLGEEFEDSNVEDKNSTSERNSSFKQKLQQFRFDPAVENGCIKSQICEDPSLQLLEFATLQEQISEPEHVALQSDFVSGNNLYGAAAKKCRISTDKSAKGPSNSSDPILRYSSVSKLEKENSEDRTLQMMLKRRRESGKQENNELQIEASKAAIETPETSTIVLETPDEMDNLDFGSDFTLESDEEFESSKPAALVDLSNNPMNTRKPLFDQGPYNPHTAPQRVSKTGTKSNAGSENIIYSSDDDVWPEENKQVQHSLSSADEIDEPEDISRKVKVPMSKKRLSRKKKSGGGNKTLLESGNKGRLSFTLGSSMMGGNNSDDDFM
eukprot:GFUD01042231.1.p1 GENE.GFUD01042231.1~~GFUD01042231.1.p1  ORF type:complete len:1506 (+),score=423.98 GFUD01042231.1:334-4518(+)